jgi:hypothetical protein
MRGRCPFENLANAVRGGFLRQGNLYPSGFFYRG